MTKRMKKTLSILLTLVMVFTMLPAITLVFDQKAAANEITFQPTSNGAYVYYCSTNLIVNYLCAV